ncbi:MAG: nitroreductase family protein [Acidimicrobiia bacterium]|nr:nitroreductase family protein [Acidimicrobiia bacterium]
MELSEAITTAVTTRYFTDEPVTDADLQAAFDYARFAPQGGNRQPVRWLIVRDGDKKRQLRDWYLQPWKAYLAAAGTGDVAIGSESLDRVLRNADHMAEHLDEVPAIVVACAELDGLHPTDHELGRLSIVGGGSVYPAVQNFLLGCREAGIGAALTTLLCMFEPQVKELLAIPDGVVTAAHIAVGRRPKPFPMKLDRIPLADTVFGDEWGTSVYA